jgi:hypothetical protein
MKNACAARKVCANQKSLRVMQEKSLRKPKGFARSARKWIAQPKGFAPHEKCLRCKVRATWTCVFQEDLAYLLKVRFSRI